MRLINTSIFLFLCFTVVSTSFLPKSRYQHRLKREIDDAFKGFVKWMTPDQLKTVNELKSSGKSEAEVREKVVGFFGELPKEKQTELKEEFKGKCKEFFTPLMTEEEISKIKTLKESKDKEGIKTLIQNVISRQNDNLKVVAGKMSLLCEEVYKDSKKKRRDLNETYKNFVKWMTAEQLFEVESMKSSGATEAEVRTKIYGFFNKLDNEKKVELKTEMKSNCKQFFSPLLNDEEKIKIKELVEAKDREGAKQLLKNVIDRQTGSSKKTAESIFEACQEVYKDSKKKRDVRQKIEKHLAWLRPEEKDEIILMTSEGKSQEEIKKKLFHFISLHEKDTTLKDKTVKNCYKWMDEVASKEEIENLHKLHHVDHNACKTKVREFINRLSGEKKEAVEASLPFCEKLWYGQHSAHTQHQHQHHHRRRRHLVVLEKYLQWLEPAQRDVIREMEEAGTEFGKISDKIREFFKTLPVEKQDELKSKFKKQCLTWAKEVAKPAEWEDIKKHYNEADYQSLIEKLIELEGRLTENQKHTIEHLRGVCYKLWGIKHHISRRRRVVKTSSEFQPINYFSWLKIDERNKLQELWKANNWQEFFVIVADNYKNLTMTKNTPKPILDVAEHQLNEGCKHLLIAVFGDVFSENNFGSTDTYYLFFKNITDHVIKMDKKYRVAGLTALRLCKRLYEKRRNLVHNMAFVHNLLFKFANDLNPLMPKLLSKRTRPNVELNQPQTFFFTIESYMRHTRRSNDTLWIAEKVFENCRSALKKRLRITNRQLKTDEKRYNLRPMFKRNLCRSSQALVNMAMNFDETYMAELHLMEDVCIESLQIICLDVISERARASDKKTDFRQPITYIDDRKPDPNRIIGGN